LESGRASQAGIVSHDTGGEQMIGGNEDSLTVDEISDLLTHGDLLEYTQRVNCACEANDIISMHRCALAAFRQAHRFPQMLRNAFYERHQDSNVLENERGLLIDALQTLRDPQNPYLVSRIAQATLNILEHDVSPEFSDYELRRDWLRTNYYEPKDAEGKLAIAGFGKMTALVKVAKDVAVVTGPGNDVRYFFLDNHVEQKVDEFYSKNGALTDIDLNLLIDHIDDMQSGGVDIEFLPQELWQLNQVPDIATQAMNHGGVTAWLKSDEMALDTISQILFRVKGIIKAEPWNWVEV
jgi:hypothetical protein